MRITNTTPFVANTTVCQNLDGRDHLVVILKATYGLESDGRVVPEEEQQPLEPTDVYYGDPLTSSIRLEGELIPPKLGTDVVLVGHAHAPSQQPSTQLDVGIKVGPVSKVIRVFGDRFWDIGLMRSRMTPALPFVTMPLVFERAFGGEERDNQKPQRHQEPRNPVGRGLVWPGNAETQPPLPNLEDPRELIKSIRDRPAPACFGFVGRHWKPRVDLVGTYDDAWRKNRFPLLPEDFDERHYQAAHPDLIATPHLRGDETVEAHHVTPDQPIWSFQLPGFQPHADVTVANHTCEVPLAFDTLVLLPDAKRFLMLWRGQLDVHNRMLQVTHIRVQGRNGSW